MVNGFLIDFKQAVQGSKQVIFLTFMADQAQQGVIGRQFNFRIGGRSSIFRQGKSSFLANDWPGNHIIAEFGLLPPPPIPLFIVKVLVLKEPLAHFWPKSK